MGKMAGMTIPGTAVSKNILEVKAMPPLSGTGSCSVISFMASQGGARGDTKGE